eukprot:COSAG01_NODE_245_length_20483_cov_32.975314_14_plen_71_part_00
MMAAFEDATAALAPGQMSGIVGAPPPALSPALSVSCAAAALTFLVVVVDLAAAGLGTDTDSGSHIILRTA